MNATVLTKLARGEPLTAEEARAHFEALLQPTNRKWSTVARKHKRDALFLEVVQRFMPQAPQASRAEQSRWLHGEGSRYLSGAWQRHRHLEQCPKQHLGKPAQWFFEIFNIKDSLPSERVLSFILRDAEPAHCHPPFKVPKDGG